MTAVVESLGSPAAAAARVAELRGLIATANGAPGPTAFQSELATAALGGATAPTAAAPIAGAASAGAGAATPFAAEIDAAAARYGIDPALLRGLIRAESNFDPNAGSPAGAQGLTQLMPGTAAGLGVTDPFDPLQSIDGGARYLRDQLDAFGGDPRLALAAYNAGPGAVQQYGGVPPYEETQAYVERVLGYAGEYRSAGAAARPAPSSSGAFPPPSTFVHPSF